jgi:hypothetical protein
LLRVGLAATIDGGSVIAVPMVDHSRGPGCTI